jgi:hypothetical protein
MRLPVAIFVISAYAQQPPPMLSPWYAESLRGVLQFEAQDVTRLEAELRAHPDDFRARLQAMAYYQRADRIGREPDRARRAAHALWLIEHHPESEILHSPVSRFAPDQLTGDERRRAVALWDAVAKARPRDAAVLWNAASFFQASDSGLHLYYLEATAAADPNHPFALRPLADLYAITILEGGPLAARAQAGLDASRNVWVLGNAAYMLQSQYNLSVQRGTRNPRAAELAERYFERAKAIDSKLDRQKILPQLPTGGTAVAAPPAHVENSRMLPVDAFPQLPAAAAGVLRARKCKMPQPGLDGSPRNLIRGEFFAKGEFGWAVLCAVNGATALLVFRNERDTNPQTVMTGGGDYPREITAVGREFILRHYRAYGGPPPPPVDHQGIDDAFLEKASVTWYFYHGKWLRLQGAD